MKIMKWLTYSWKIGYLREVEIRVHFSLLFSLVVFCVLSPITLERGALISLWLAGFVCSTFLHELAHALAAKRMGVGAKSIVIWLLGGFTVLNCEPEKPLHRLAVYAAGPLVTAVFAVIGFVVYFSAVNNASLFLSNIFVQLCFTLAFTNLILLIFNILPVYPLDGGNIFHSLMELLFGKPSANLITMIVSVPVLIALIVVGIYWHDYVLLGSTIFIALGVGTLNKTTLRGINLGANYLLKRGGYYLLKGDYDRAEKYYARKIMREPDQADHYIARGIAYLWMLQKQKALADIEYALKLAPKNEIVILLRADLYALDNNYDSALALILQAQELKPNWAPALMDHGSVLMYRAEFQPALAEIDKAISLLAQIPLFYVERSIVHFKLGDLDAAHKDQDAALQLSEKDALIRADFNLKAYEGFLDWAEEYYARALLKLPRSWYAYLGRGDAYRANGEYDKAILNYTQALRINPREPRLYLSRGKCYQATGELNCAEIDFRQVNVVTKLAHYRRHAEELLETFKGD